MWLCSKDHHAHTGEHHVLKAGPWLGMKDTIATGQLLLQLLAPSSRVRRACVAKSDSWWHTPD